MSLAGYLVIVNEGSVVTFTPSDGTSYSEGSQGSDEVIYVGASTSYNHTSLTAGSTYYYAIYSHDGGYNYSVVASTSSIAGGYPCGDSGDGCYDNTQAKTIGRGFTPSGKLLEYVYANGTSGLQVWKEAGGHRILKPNGMDEWVKKLNLNGKGQSATDFTDVNIGTASTLIADRVCPPNVYQDDSNKFTTGNCLYITPEYNAQTLSVAGTSQTVDGQIGLANHSNAWYAGNIQTCASKGMRLPTIFETTTTTETYPSYPTSDGAPVFARSNGVPSLSGITWTASGASGYPSIYFNWSGTGVSNDSYYISHYVRCVVM